MNTPSSYLFIFLFALFSCNKTDTLFERLPTKETGIDFVNEIIENDSINILAFEYVYNGGGVAMADFNNDGMKDLFFSANMAGNKLYLNKGNFKFEDITQTARIEGAGKWCTAAVAVDINFDGWMDIYVPASSTPAGTAESRKNLLYVNQHGERPSFKEMAVEYGIADDGFSEGAAFFDYDNDGDLDLYVLTNQIDERPNYFRKKVNDGTYPNTDRLYRNDWNEGLGHPVFTNVSKQSGIVHEGFGLGINITDINKDGWKDIFVTNDYVSNDILYINNQDGTFTDQAAKYFKHTGYSSMGNDVADINNDGHQDLFVLDMMPEDNHRKKMFVSSSNPDWFRMSDQWGYIYQYMRNTLQLNSGMDGDFQEIGLLSGVSETDWSWTPSLADFDNDGWVDLLITNGFPKDVTDKDFMQYRAEADQLVSKKKLLTQIPQVKIANYAYRNNGNLTFTDMTNAWGLNEPSFSSGAAFGDLDNDGDLDYVVNNTADPAFVYRNKIADHQKGHNYLTITFEGEKQNPDGIGATLLGTIKNKNDYYFEMNPYRGYKSTVGMECHIGLKDQNTVKALTVVWPNGKAQTLHDVKANQRIKLKMVDAKDHFDWNTLHTHKEEPFFRETSALAYTHNELPFLDINIQNALPFSLADMGPGAAVADVNEDHLDDIFIGGAKFKKGVFFIQQPDGRFSRQDLLPPADSTRKLSEDTGVLLFDADLDGDNDLYIVSGGNEDLPDAPSFRDHFFINDGRGHFTEASEALPDLLISGSCVRAADYDQDGDLDLFISGRNTPAQYPKHTSSTILRNDSRSGKPLFVDITSKIAPGLRDFGLVCDALWTDFDNDGDQDIILAGDFAPIGVFENREGEFVLVEKTGLEDYSGIWSSITSGDYDQDGDMDYIVGNIGENGRFKGTRQFPAMLLSGDFDNNGRYEVLPFLHFSERDGRKVFAPYNGKDDASRQYNPLRGRFKNYAAYAQANADNLLTEQEKKLAQKHYLNYCSSAVVENLGKGKFALKALPVETQFAPIAGMLTDDYNADGILDVLITGNKFNNELSVGKMDALNGVLLLGHGDGTFSVRKNSGFKVAGNARSLVTLSNARKERLLLALQNRGPALLYSIPKAEGYAFSLTPSNTRYTYEFKGHKILMETSFGSSYLSQSARSIWVPKGAKNIRVY